ncbi:MAG TPA: addiction module protein [Verrucomicrobiales bacterium]|nr:addiction module protein [Verrucomicrobiales bacterium]HRJ09597.1 addiction module protein [Prosthecobacter sp.]HRK12644.1 addiction module protein [Prosthecobacter sp.]
MNATVPSPVDELLEAAKRLSNREQGEFLDRFLDLNYEGDDTDEEQPLPPEWMAEIERRVAEVEAGTAILRDWQDVLEEARESLQRPA